MADKNPLDFLIKFNDFLEQVPTVVLSFFERTFKAGQTTSQSYVDLVCRYVSWKINLMIERARQKVLKSLCDQYGWIGKVASAVNVGKQVVSNPIGAVGSFFGLIVAPASAVVDFIITLAVELPRLAANLAKIASALPPEPPDPSINFNEFKIKLGGISMGTLLSADSLPPPEVVVGPEPPSPWSKEAFSAAFDAGKEDYNKDKVIYKPKTQEEREADHVVRRAELAKKMNDEFNKPF